MKKIATVCSRTQLHNIITTRIVFNFNEYSDRESGLEGPRYKYLKYIAWRMVIVVMLVAVVEAVTVVKLQVCI